MKITEIERLEFRPGDRVVVHLAYPVDAAQAAHAAEHVRAALRLGQDVGVMVLGPGESVEVVAPAEGLEITR